MSEDVQPEVVDLWGEDKGSFEFPPRPRDAEQLVNFWRTVEIPESVARAVVQQQRLLAHEYGALAEREAEREFLAAKRKTDVGYLTTNEKAELEQAKTAAYERGYKSVIQFDQGHVYPAIRAASMYRDSVYLSPEERQKVHDLQLRFPGGMLTPKRIWDGYRFQHLQDVMGNAEARIVSALEKIAVAVEELNDRD